MATNTGLVHRLGRAFVLQAAFISVAAIVGVWVAGFAIEELLIKRALKEEAAYFWQLHRSDPDTPLPDTRNLTGYMHNSKAPVPQAIAELGLGFHEMPSEADFSIVYVSEDADQRLLLTFDGERVSELALYFGLTPLMGALVVVYLATWISFRSTRRAISPIIALAREVHDYDPTAPDAPVFVPTSAVSEGDGEVQALADALQRLSHRVRDFVERERNFTRDASHELRSPLTVIQIAADMLLSEQVLEKPAQRSVHRIKRSASDMEELVRAFLLLARESEQQLEQQSVSVNDVVSEELETSQVLIEDKPVAVTKIENSQITVQAPRRIVAVLIGNLVRNAFGYTDAGSVDITIDGDKLIIEDSGVGMESQAVEQAFKPFFRGAGRVRGGHGVGLTIVKRLSDRFGWPVRIDSRPGQGTRVEVTFADALSQPRNSDV